MAKKKVKPVLVLLPDDVKELHTQEVTDFLRPHFETIPASPLNLMGNAAIKRDTIVGERIVSACAWIPDPERRGEILLAWMATRFEYRKKGFGTHILRTVLNGQLRGFNVNLWVRCGNKAAIALYEKVGFKCLGCCGAYQDGEPAMHYRFESPLKVGG